MWEENRKTCVDNLPIVLYSNRTTPKGPEKLSPYEILFGIAPKTGFYLPQQLQALHSDMTGYVSELQKQLMKVHQYVCDSIPDPKLQPETHNLVPGDWVSLKNHVRKSLEPRFDGPQSSTTDHTHCCKTKRETEVGPRVTL